MYLPFPDSRKEYFCCPKNEVLQHFFVHTDPKLVSRTLNRCIFFVFFYVLVIRNQSQRDIRSSQDISKTIQIQKFHASQATSLRFSYKLSKLRHIFLEKFHRYEIYIMCVYKKYQKFSSFTFKTLRATQLVGGFEIKHGALTETMDHFYKNTRF